MSEATQTSGCFENILKYFKSYVTFGEGLFLMVLSSALPSAPPCLDLKCLKVVLA